MPLMDENHDHDWLAHGVAETAGSFFDVAFDEWGIFAILAVVVFLFVSVLGFLFAGESFQNLRLK